MQVSSFSLDLLQFFLPLPSEINKTKRFLNERNKTINSKFFFRTFAIIAFISFKEAAVEAEEAEAAEAALELATGAAALSHFLFLPVFLELALVLVVTAVALLFRFNNPRR